MKIAILEDDGDIARLVAGWLNHSQYEVEHFESGAALLRVISGKHYDLMIFDWMLPGMSGLEVVKRLRASGSRVPVLFLTQFDSADNVATALEAGANDYLAKPVTRNLLITRVQALLGPKADIALTRDVTRGRYRTDHAARTVYVDHNAVVLSATQFALIWLLITQHGRLVTRSELRHATWGLEHDDKQSTQGMDFEVTKVKDKLDLDGTKGLDLVRVHNLGYRLEDV